MSQAFRKDSKKSWITRCPQKKMLECQPKDALVKLYRLERLWRLSVTHLLTHLLTDSASKNYSALNKQPGLGDSEQGAFSFGSPSQASAEGALLQLRDLNFLPLDKVESQSDHSPHSAQSPATTNKKDQTISDALHIVGCLIFTGIQKITS